MLFLCFDVRESSLSPFFNLKQVSLAMPCLANEVESIGVRNKRQTMSLAFEQLLMGDVRIFEENSTGAIPKQMSLAMLCLANEVEGKFVRSSKAVATSKRQERRPLMSDVRIFEENSTGAIPNKAKARQTCQLEQNEGAGVRNKRRVKNSAFV